MGRISQLRRVLDELLDAFSIPATPGQVDVVFRVLGSALWGGPGLCLSGLLIPTVLFYLVVRWRFAEVALMAEEMGPLQSLRRSWNLSRGYVLRTLGFFLLILIIMGIIGALIGGFVGVATGSLAPAADQSMMFGFNYALSKLLSIFAAPFYVTVFVLYYFDLRVRKEQHDFEVVQE